MRLRPFGDVLRMLSHILFDSHHLARVVRINCSCVLILLSSVSSISQLWSKFFRLPLLLVGCVHELLLVFSLCPVMLSQSCRVGFESSIVVCPSFLVMLTCSFLCEKLCCDESSCLSTFQFIVLIVFASMSSAKNCVLQICTTLEIEKQSHARALGAGYFY